MEPLKEMFSHAWYQHCSEVFAIVYKKFDAEGFFKMATANLSSLELNQRLRNTSLALKEYLPADYPQSLKIMYKAAPLLKRGYTALFLPDFVSVYGREHFELSLQALKFFTSFGSSEFAIREFIRIDARQTLKVMCEWAEDKDPHVRRLASEGSRPRLPWSFRLDAIIKEPGLTRPILEKLKSDTERYVKKSVANHLNDISRDHPNYMIDLVKTWNSDNPDTRWIIKHACRSLIKKGDKNSLAIFQFEKNVKVKVDKLTLNAATIRLGEELIFSFELQSEKKSTQKLVIDYAIHYPKAKGKLNRKVFKLKEIKLEGGQKMLLMKKQLFKDFTTRKHYAGKHIVEILVNGQIMAEKPFRLRLQ